MSKRSEFKLTVKKWGATFEEEKESNPIRIIVDAPDGFRWFDSGASILTAYIYSEWKESAGEAYQDLINRMNEGTEEMSEEEKAIF